MRHDHTSVHAKAAMSGAWLHRLAALGLGLAITALPALAQTRFPSAEAAADAFVDALATSDNERLHQILGPGYRSLHLEEASRDDKLDFLAAWAKGHRVVSQGQDRAVLEVGDSNWMLPIPIANGSRGWAFDTRAGADELNTKRIGRNELAVMEAVLAYFDMQKEYASKERQSGQGLVYARKFFSSPGKQDGLYWPSAPGEEASPMGPGYAAGGPGGAYHGYNFRILGAQGRHASGGAYDYVDKGRMNGGFALIAWPVKYGYSGIMSFMVSHDGVVYQKTLGPGGDAIARSMRAFDPDASWQVVKPPSTLAAR
jgi:Protein of unknown function (DUF2950)